MGNHLGIQYGINTAKVNNEGNCPLLIRVTYQKVRKGLYTGFYISPAKWDNKKKKVRGADEETRKINDYIMRSKVRLIELFNEMLWEGDIILEKLLDRYMGRCEEKDYYLLELITQHNEIVKSKIGIDYSLATYKKYRTTSEKVALFIPHQFKKKDIRIKDLRIKFLEDFEFFQKSVLKTHHNTTMKHCKNIKKIITEAVKYGWLDKNPFIGFKTSYTDTDKTYLTEAEIKLIENKNFSIIRLQIVKDLFLFQCFTGLSFTDLHSLTKKDVSVGIDGNKWIIIRRNKTNIQSTIPLLPQALKIIEKYKSFSDDDRLLPVYANQKYNSYLEEIADFCGITKKITTHVGRRSFGNLALANGISLNVIAKVLGHSSTIITQKIYAVTNEQIISKEMEVLRNRLSIPK